MYYTRTYQRQVFAKPSQLVQSFLCMRVDKMRCQDRKGTEKRYDLLAGTGTAFLCLSIEFDLYTVFDIIFQCGPSFCRTSSRSH